MKITEKWLKEKRACSCGVNWWNENGSPETPAGIIQEAINTQQWGYAYWIIRRTFNKKQSVTLAIFAAEKVIDIFENKYPDDNRPRKAIEAAKSYLRNPCKKTKAAAANAAYAAAANAVYAAAYAAAADAAADDARNKMRVTILEKAIEIIKPKETV